MVRWLWAVALYDLLQKVTREDGFKGFLQMEMINIREGGDVDCLDLMVAYFMQVPSYYTKSTGGQYFALIRKKCQKRKKNGRTEIENRAKTTPHARTKSGLLTPLL